MSKTSKTNIEVDCFGGVIEVSYTDLRIRKRCTSYFESVDDLKTFIYALRQALFNFEINNSVKKPRTPKIPRGC